MDKVFVGQENISLWKHSWKESLLNSANSQQFFQMESYICDIWSSLGPNHFWSILIPIKNRKLELDQILSDLNRSEQTIINSWVGLIEAGLDWRCAFLKQCFHNLQFIKTRCFSPHLCKLAPAGNSWSTFYS